MKKWLLGGVAAVGAILAWILRGFFADRTEARLKKERDTALADAKQESVTAAAKTAETEAMKAQQKNEDAAHAADSGGISSRLDGMFK